MKQGFSLTEVLVSLVLMTSTALVLVKQQWQTSQFFNHSLQHHHTILLFDNGIERRNTWVNRSGGHHVSTGF